MIGVSSYGKPVFGFFILIGLSVVFGAVVPQVCNKSNCKGPIKYYKILNCTPVYNQTGDCCPVRYECPDLSGRATDKCYVNGKVYKIGDKLADEDRSGPCDINCTCDKELDDVAKFVCDMPECDSPVPNKGCYIKEDLNTCCGFTEVCPKSNASIAKCEFLGKTYTDGQMFHTNDGHSCVCSKGYTGKNVEPFCRKWGSYIELDYPRAIRDNCSPVFNDDKDIITFLCQEEVTVDLMAKYTSSSGAMEVPNDMKCKFGKMTMRIGDTFRQPWNSTTGELITEECVCEVPPTPSCRRF